MIVKHIFIYRLYFVCSLTVFSNFTGQPYNRVILNMLNDNGGRTVCIYTIA